MAIRLILAPYDSGHREWRMGAGPTHLLRHGLASRVRALGHEIGAELAEVPERPGTEIESSFALWREVARRVRLARERGELPVVLSGNCGATIGAVAGTVGDVAVVWLDAHGDFNTPETSERGFLDGMALSTLAGRCWRTVAASVGDFRPVPAQRIVHVGARALDPEEATQLAESGIACVPAAALCAGGVAATLAPVLDRLATAATRVHLHVDLDVLDPVAVGQANCFTPAGGLRTEALIEAATLIGRRLQIVGATLSAYDPLFDTRAGVFDAATQLVEAIARG